MIDLRKQTIDTYNNSAQKLAEYFSGIGPRIDDINLALNLAGVPNSARIVEIGCGDGRDAKEIIQHAAFYEGFDISEKLIEIAKAQVPEASFQVADAVRYEFPDQLDVVFAFASLLHLDKTEVQTVFDHVAGALRPGGVLYVSLKYRPEYQQDIKEDQFGKRLFYFYNEDTISALAESNFETVYVNRKFHGNTDWLEMALQKVD